MATSFAFSALAGTSLLADIKITCTRGRLGSARMNGTKMLVDLRELQSIGSMGIGFIVGVYVSRHSARSPGARASEASGAHRTIGLERSALLQSVVWGQVLLGRVRFP
jgi:hypothetical protein